ncbi:hypothetical protein FE257_003277 [Aspergillus nanangensis]|uniref:Uncharacterized protein n=1 Tax=Aspergillus nanangensis TaxID=2582783 RepID=A0AAD4CS98_ASPNN|nr:hypothetical protein FE257_003277 [Aspergillus nanangensis]
MRLNISEPTTPTLSRQNTTLLNGHYYRTETHPHLLSTRRKPRRWPLVFRFIKGAIHAAILLPVVLHALFTAFVVCLDKYIFETVGLPSSMIPSLSIVVGLMLVFRNQTSYNRFWDGRNGMNTVYTCIRNLVRTIVTNGYNTKGPISPAEKQDIERTVRILMAIPFAVKNHLRAEWGAAWALGNDVGENGVTAYNQDYASLLPLGLEGHEPEGLGLPYQLTFFVDGFIKRGEHRGWFNAPGASQMQAQLNALMEAYGRMETIKLTPIPVAHLIHQKQVLALYGCVLPFGMVDDLGWWTVPIVSLVIFTLYGIEGIGSQLEDPFGYDRNDIKMDAIVGDAKTEIGVVLSEWRKTVSSVDSATTRLDPLISKPVNNAPNPTVEATYVPPEIFVGMRPRTARGAFNDCRKLDRLNSTVGRMSPLLDRISQMNDEKAANHAHNHGLSNSTAAVAEKRDISDFIQKIQAMHEILGSSQGKIAQKMMTCQEPARNSTVRGLKAMKKRGDDEDDDGQCDLGDVLESLVDTLECLLSFVFGLLGGVLDLVGTLLDGVFKLIDNLLDLD